MKVKIKIWIEDDEQNHIFGRGKNKVLESIDKTGSISKAAKEVGMNYKKAWSHVKILEENAKELFVSKHKGQGESSGSTLTPKAKELIELYNILQDDITSYAQKRFNELFKKTNF